MPCQEISSWTFTGLAGAFLDLSIAFLLLCGSALVFSTSKLLGLFGLSLPCPCDGLFSDHNKNRCFQKILKNLPADKIYFVRASVVRKTPFDLVFTQDRSICPSKGFAVRRMTYGLRRRRKVASHRGKLFTVSTSDHLQSDIPDLSWSPASDNKLENHNPEKSPYPVKCEDEGQAMEGETWSQGISHASEVPDQEKENNPPQRFASHVKVAKQKPLVDLGFEGNAWDTIKVLKQALEDEQTARVALSLELEKERNAAASAADEAMAMILRLQEEKASVEMEARQYQRMTEEKSAFDAEEMNILKEILLRREREKHFLEKEVETYRQMLLENERLEISIQDKANRLGTGTSLLYSNEDPKHMLHQIGKSFNEMEEVDTGNDFVESDVASTWAKKRVLALGNELAVPRFDDDADYLKQGDTCHDISVPSGIEEKELNDLSNSDQLTLDGNDIPEKTFDLVQENLVKTGRENLCQHLHGSNVINPYNVGKLEKPEEDSDDLRFGPDWVHDVHVIRDEVGLSTEEDQSKLNGPEMNDSFKHSRLDDAMSRVRQDFELDRSRSISDIPHKFSLACPRGKSFSLDMRRKSMSAVDYERLKIENEVGWLRGRLRVVQEGREKLNFSAGRKEKENALCQHLENVVNQLHGIRQLADAGSLIRRGSLPPQASKVKGMSKRSRRQSAPLDLHTA